MIKKFFSSLERHHILVFIVLLFVFVMRFPSLFEPFWYGDEGIFAAVAKNLTHGGVLYKTAWDNKPPMIYLTYAAIFDAFGVSMFWLRVVTAIVVLCTAATVYEIGQIIFGRNRAVVATIIFGTLTSMRLIEGNLALTEIYMILPICLAMYIAVKRNFSSSALAVSGLLFAIASLYKQVGAFEAGALGLFMLLSGKSIFEFVKRGFALTLGFTIPFIVTILYFASHGIVDEYIFGAYGYYKIYLGESPQYAALLNVSKYVPILAAFGYGLWKRKNKENIEVSYLLFLWAAFSFLGSYFSGRTYGHYLIQAAPAVSLLLASVKFDRLRLTVWRTVFIIVFCAPILFLTSFLFSNFLSGGPINQLRWWQNFLEYSQGKKTVDSYNDFFDGNVNTIMALADSLKVNGAYGNSLYIWGDYPWLYAIDDAKNPSRYVTSFHVGGVPDGYAEVGDVLSANPPNYIIKPDSSIGYFDQLEKLLIRKYTLQAKVGTAEVYLLRSDQ